MQLQHINCKIRFKIDDFDFEPRFDLHFSLYCTNKNDNDTLVRLIKYMFCIAIITHPPMKSIYEVTAHKMQNYTKNLRFYFDPHFLPPFCLFLKLSDLLRPKYALQSTFLVFSCLHNHF